MPERMKRSSGVNAEDVLLSKQRDSAVLADCGVALLFLAAVLDGHPCRSFITSSSSVWPWTSTLRWTYAPSVAGRLFVIISLAVLMWVLSAAHTLPIDADGPSGLSDNADFDDLIVSLTSPTAAVAPVLVLIPPASVNLI